MKHFKWALSLILAGAFCLSGAGCGGEGTKNDATFGTAMNDSFYNPLRVEAGLGDPWVYKHDGNYYLTYSEGTQITVTKSPWMTNLTANAGDETRTKVVARQKAMSLVEIWAPEIFFFDGHWYIYFTATRDNSDNEIKDANRRTYCLKSKGEDVFGEWENVVEIKLPEDLRAIDATFMDYNGKQYIVWARWPEKNHTIDYRQDLYIAELAEKDPTKAKTTEGKRVMISTPEYDWEKLGASQNEGPVVTYSPQGNPALLFSGSYSGSDGYCIGYLTLEGSEKDPLHPDSWTKGEKPLMETEDDVISPGHNSVVKSPDDSEYWIAYHAAKYSGAGWDRTLRYQKMTWNGNVPVVERIYSYNEAAPMPSGEKTNRIRYEAEDAVLGESCTVTEVTYENGEGTIPAASGGKAVRISDAEDKLTFKVNVKANGQYRILLRYSNQAVSATTVEMIVNGTSYQLYTPKTPYDDTFSNNAFFCDLFLKPNGPNDIEIKCDQNILLDCIVVDALDK